MGLTSNDPSALARLAALPDAERGLSRRALRLLLLFVCGALLGAPLAGCSSVVETLGSKIDPAQGDESAARMADGTPSKRSGHYKVGKPYTIRGKTYYPKDDPNYSAVGLASWYGRDFHGGKTANGEVFDMTAISAAHKTMPLPSYARVTNLRNGRSIIVRVNNRGPFVAGRLIDVSRRTAELLDFAKFGVAKVRVDYVGPAPLDRSEDSKLAMTLREDGNPAEPPAGDGTIKVASAKPFVPNVDEAVPQSHGDIPMPLSRPYDLGTQTASDQGSTGGGGTQVAAAGWAAGPEPVSGLGYAGVPASDGMR